MKLVNEIYHPEDEFAPVSGLILDLFRRARKILGNDVDI